MVSNDFSRLTTRWTQLMRDTNWFTSAADYWVDTCQKSLIYTDILRRRGNIYIEHASQGMPPVLVFDYETIVDGRQLERPVNYALVSIIDRRSQERQGPKKQTERRKKEEISAAQADKRPIVIIDPRAGHGPGIGGSKRDSEIGIALDAGHPVYFIIFYPQPVKGQTLADVRDAEVLFLETVAQRHPQAEKPAVIGNCQGGWAAALIGGSRPDVAGPMVFNGSPLSYWGGVEGANPMRYRGGLCGGAWVTSMANDLGNGRFDGAHLVAGFEDLNPANTYWSKQYNVYTHCDTEENRYLSFERWWNGFYLMNAEEIHFIVDSLFIGNKLETGELVLEDGTTVDLKKMQGPIVVFASRGDNITPPQQALNWIVKVYHSVEEIKRHGQVIVYMVHENIGHLGIFVSAKVARKEHKQIIGSFDMLDYLAPGLYEMVIDETPLARGDGAAAVRFEERDMDHIMGLDDGFEDEEDFKPAAYLSQVNDQIYRTLWSPWVKMAISEPVAEWIRQVHPLRLSKYLLSDMNPLMLPVRALAETAKEHRRKAEPDNPFLAFEKDCADGIVDALNLFRDVRDTSQEFIFKMLYGNAWMKWLFSEPAGSDAAPRQLSSTDDARQRLQREAASGGFEEAAVRVIILLLKADRIFERSEYQAARQVVLEHKTLRKIAPFDLKRIAKQQAMILQADEDLALETLPHLLQSKAQRREVLRIAEQILTNEKDLPNQAKTVVYKRIQAILAGKRSQSAL
jgi:pimeloyl-ACP methyl ester carboxylesterase